MAEHRASATCASGYTREKVGDYWCSGECSNLDGKPIEEVEAHARACQDKKKWKTFIRDLDADRRKQKKA